MITDPNKIFDTKSAAVQALISERNWEKLIERNKIIRILDFLKNDIVFGFTKKACLPASEILTAGHGQALTKSILLKTLFDACGVLCRFHAFKIKKELYKGLARPFDYKLLPNTLISTWIEVFFEEQWLVADGILLDSGYMRGLQNGILPSEGEFIGMGAGIFLSGNSRTIWNGKNHTYCQRAAIAEDMGIIDNFEWFFSEYKPEIKQLGKISHKFANMVINTVRTPQ